MEWLVNAFPDLTRPRPFRGTSLHCPCSSAQSVKEEEHGQWLWVAATRKASEVQLKTKLNVTRRARRPDRTETAIRRPSRGTAIGIQQNQSPEAHIRPPEVCSIESIEHVSLEAQPESFIYSELLAQREVPGL